MRISDWSSDVCSSDLISLRLVIHDIGVTHDNVASSRRPCLPDYPVVGSTCRALLNPPCQIFELNLELLLVLLCRVEQDESGLKPAFEPCLAHPKIGRAHV